MLGSPKLQNCNSTMLSAVRTAVTDVSLEDVHRLDPHRYLVSQQGKWETLEDVIQVISK